MNDHFKNTEHVETADAAPVKMPVLRSAVSSPMATMLDPGLYAQLKKVAATFAESQLIPQRFRDKPHDVFIALHMAYRLGCDPILVLQNLYAVHGEPGWKSQFIIAQANLSGVFKGRIKFDIKNAERPKDMSVTAWAILKDGEERVEATVTMAMAQAEGWVNNKKYQSMPDHMLCYRAATFLVRRHAPEVMLGIPVVDEIEDLAVSGQVIDAPMQDEPVNVTASEVLKRAGQANPDQGEQGQQSPPSGEASAGGKEAVGAGQGDEWPKWQPDLKFWTDSAGKLFDKTRHGWNAKRNRPSVKQDGTFKARRGAGSKPGDPPPATRGESPQVVDEPPLHPAGPDKSTVLKWIEASADADDLDVCADAMRNLSESEREICNQALRERGKQLKLLA